MYKLKLENFKNYSSAKFEIKQDSIILIKGVSGSGKTSIIKAIQWCLFEKCKCVSPLSNQKARTIVIFESEDWKIRRQKNPRRLTIETQKFSYEDEEAQCFINEEFGEKNIWLTSSIISQKKRCDFLDMNKQERLDFLNTFVFGNKDPKIYSKIVKDKYDELNSKYKSLSDKREKLLEVYNNQISEREYVLPLSKEEREEINSELKKLTQDILILEDKVKENRQIKGKKEEVQRQLEEKKNTLIKLPEFTRDEDQKELKKEIKELEVLKSKKDKSDYSREQVKKLKQKLKQIERFDLNEKFDTKEILKIKLNESKINEYEKKCKKINISYSDKLEVEKSKLQERMYLLMNLRSENEKIIDLKNKQNKAKKDFEVLQSETNKLEKEKKTIESKLSLLTFDDNEIERLENSIKRGKVYICPKCDSNLYIQNNKLCETNENIEDENEMKSKLEKQKKNKKLFSIEKENLIKVNHNLELKIQSLESKRNILDEITKELDNREVTDDKDYDEISQKLKILNSIEYLEKSETSSTEMEEHNEHLELETKITELSKDISDNFDSLEDLSYKKKQLEDMMKTQEKKKMLIKDVKNLEQRLENLSFSDEFEPQLEQKKKQIKQIKEDFEFDDYCLQMKSKYDELELIENELDKLYSDTKSLDRLNKNISKVEYSCLTDAITNVNIKINDYLSSLFTDPINITLDLIKQGKNNNLRTGLFMKIFHNNIEYNSISEMSGGEEDRISISMLLAFSSICSSKYKFVVLDETFLSLNQSVREKCVKILREHSDATCIAISHEDIEGYYDYTIECC